jgi:ribosomal protein S18 acetylase RimI-like enzyme
VNIRLQFTTSGILWEQVAEILKSVGMAYHSPQRHETAFRNSHAVVFAFVDEKMAGFGRAISDGAYQAAIYDVAVLPEFQGLGIGKLIVRQIVDHYEKFSFRKMKTGMALFTDIEKMKQNGFTE